MKAGRALDWLARSETYALHGLDELDLRGRDGEIVDVPENLGFGTFADGQDHHISLLSVSQLAAAALIGRLNGAARSYRRRDDGLDLP